MKISKFALVSISSFVVATAATRACDLCGCYTPQLETTLPQQTDPLLGQTVPTTPIQSSLDHLYGAVGEQFTHFATVQVNGHEVSNPTGQREESSITQLVAGYTFNQRFGLQLNVPFIYRYYKRPEGFDIQRGAVSGLGDVSLLAKFVVFHTESNSRNGDGADGKDSVGKSGGADFAMSAVLLGGVKLPTGDSSRIKEEFHESEVEGAPESGIHGHDLTLGTGSYDGIFGAQISLRYRDAFFEAETQFTLRGASHYSYHFANELSWSGGPGWYLVRRDDRLLGLQFVLSGESKDTDRFQGKVAEDTGVTSLYLGPRALASFGRYSGEVGLDIPTIMNNTKLQVVPDYRIRAGFSVRF
jgi:hypothetical protein